ncbi:MAG: hypothetical protein EOM24_03845 [Chloroflexia bacterium]|nr:hypothetical protein [Chloroflexia bacterium]
MPTTPDCTTQAPPLEAPQGLTLTIELDPYHAALLLSEIEHQNSWYTDWCESRGYAHIEGMQLTPETYVRNMVRILLDTRAQQKAQAQR